MGKADLPTVEENTPTLDEPPIGGSEDPHTAPHHRQLQPNLSDGKSPSTLFAPHTLSHEEVARRLGVDIK